VDLGCDDLKKAVERRKKDWCSRLHPDKTQSLTADKTERATACFRSLNNMWETAEPMGFQLQGPGLTQAQRKHKIAWWTAKNAATPMKKPAVRQPPPKPMEKPKSEPPPPPPIDRVKRVAKALLQRIACHASASAVDDGRLIVREVPGDVLVGQAVRYLSAHPIAFKGDASDVKTIEARIDEFLQPYKSSEDERALVICDAAQRYLQDPDVKFKREVAETEAEKQAVDAAMERLRSGTLTIRSLYERGDALLQDAKIALRTTGASDDKLEKLATEIVSHIGTEACAAQVQERRSERAKAEKNSLYVGDIDHRPDVFKAADKEADKERREEIAYERLSEEGKARIDTQHKRSREQHQSSSRMKEEQHKRSNNIERSVRAQRKQQECDEAEDKQRRRKQEEEDALDADVLERRVTLSGLGLDQRRWKDGLPVEEEPVNALPVVPWTAGARPAEPTTKARVVCLGATFDHFPDRPSSYKIDSPAPIFLETILNATGKRGAVELRACDGKPQLLIHSERKPRAVGWFKIKAYVQNALMPMVKVIEDLRRLGTRRLISTWTKKDNKDVQFEVGHTPEGVALLRLRVDGKVPIVKQGAEEVLRYIESALPYEKGELRLLFQNLEPVSVDDVDPSEPRTGVHSIDPSALLSDKGGRELLYKCYDPSVRERPLKEFCKEFRTPIDPPPKAAKEALAKAEKKLAEAKEKLAEAKEKLAEREAQMKTLREALAKRETEAETAKTSYMQDRCNQAKCKVHSQAQRAVRDAECAIKKEIEQARAPENAVRGAQVEVANANAALYEPDASLIVSVAATYVPMGRLGQTDVWLCHVADETIAAFATEEWLKTKFSSQWLRECKKAAAYQGRFRLVTHRAWQLGSAAPRPTVPPKLAPPKPAPAPLDSALLQLMYQDTPFWRKEAEREFKNGWAPSPSDAYAIAKTDGTWWVLLASLGDARPHPVALDWVLRHFKPLFGPQRKSSDASIRSLLIRDHIRVGHAASENAIAAMVRIDAAEKAAKDATETAAAGSKLLEAKTAAEPHLPTEPIKSLMLSYTLKYRGAESVWFGEFPSGVAPVHGSVVHACFEPAFHRKCWEAFVAVTEASLTAFGREKLGVASSASDAPAPIVHEKLPAGIDGQIDWQLYKGVNDKLLGVGYNDTSWHVYYECVKADKQMVFQIPLRGVNIEGELIPQYLASGTKGTLSKTMSTYRGRAKDRNEVKLPPLHPPPAAPLALMDKRADSESQPPKKRKVDNEASASNRPKRAAAAKATDAFEGSSEVDESEDDESVVEDDGSESDEQPVRERKRKATGGMAKLKKPRAAAVVTGVPVTTAPSVDGQSQVEGLAELLADAKCTDKLAVAKAWCITQGADSVADLENYVEEFVQHLDLLRIKKDKLLAELTKRFN
jgi:hypothetical protein